MKVLKPFFYDEFNCIGSKCIDTCCAGWGIEIDEVTLKKYENVTGYFGNKLKDSIQKGKKNYFVLNEKNTCPFLNQDSLCDIYIHIGEDNLCRTCNTYPRITRRYQDIYEQNLVLSCPEVAKIIVKENSSFEFCFGEYKDDCIITVDNSNLELLNALIMGRGLSVDIMQLRDIPIWMRIYLCISIADKIQKNININSYGNIKKNLQSYYDYSYLNNYIHELAALKENIKLKCDHYKILLNAVKELQLNNRLFVGYLDETIHFFVDNDEWIETLIQEIIHSYDRDNSDKVFIYENLIVYYLFHYYMSSYQSENIDKYIVFIVETYALIKLISMIHWYNSSKIIKDHEMIEIIYSYSRAIEHVSENIDKFYDTIKDKGYDKLSYLITLIQ